MPVLRLIDHKVPGYTYEKACQIFKECAGIESVTFVKASDGYDIEVRETGQEYFALHPAVRCKLASKRLEILKPPEYRAACTLTAKDVKHLIVNKSEKNILKDLRSNNIAKIEQISKIGGKLKIEFESPEDADYVLRKRCGIKMSKGLIAHEQLVEERFNPLNQCMKCFSYEHDSVDCRREQICFICSEEGHEGHGCTNKDNVSCVNCGGEHFATAFRCPIRKARVREFIDDRKAKTSRTGHDDATKKKDEASATAEGASEASNRPHWASTFEIEDDGYEIPDLKSGVEMSLELRLMMIRCATHMFYPGRSYETAANCLLKSYGCPPVNELCDHDKVILGMTPFEAADDDLCDMPGETCIRIILPDELVNKIEHKLWWDIEVFNEVRVRVVKKISPHSILVIFRTKAELKKIVSRDSLLMEGVCVPRNLFSISKFNKASQCTKCYSYEHKTKDCDKANQCCAFCSKEGHHFNQCARNLRRCCINCGGNHLAISEKCPSRRLKERELDQALRSDLNDPPKPRCPEELKRVTRIANQYSKMMKAILSCKESVNKDCFERVIDVQREQSGKGLKKIGKKYPWSEKNDNETDSSDDDDYYPTGIDYSDYPVSSDEDEQFPLTALLPMLKVISLLKT